MALAILMKEVGEAAQAALQDNEPGGESWDYRKELIHVAAVDVRMVETFDRRMSLPFGGGSDSTTNGPGTEIQRLMLEINSKNAVISHLEARLDTANKAIEGNKELRSIIDYLAGPSPTEENPEARARIGTESGKVRGKPGAWDGGKKWAETDARIARAFDKGKT